MIKVDDLAGAQLDYWVAKAEGLNVFISEDFVEVEYEPENWKAFLPSTNWRAAGPLIDKHKISVVWTLSDWIAGIDGRYVASGSTALEAVCRALVRDVFGNKVEEAK